MDQNNKYKQDIGKLDRIALAILEKCKSESLTVYEIEAVLEAVRNKVSHSARL